jgi:hypothetical protein
MVNVLRSSKLLKCSSSIQHEDPHHKAHFVRLLRIGASGKQGLDHGYASAEGRQRERRLPELKGENNWWSVETFNNKTEK